jgi:hypothetical protein
MLVLLEFLREDFLFADRAFATAAFAKTMVVVSKKVLLGIDTPAGNVY